MAWPPINAGMFGQGYRFSATWINQYIDKINDYANRIPFVNVITTLPANELIRVPILQTKLGQIALAIKGFTVGNRWLREAYWDDCDGIEQAGDDAYYTVQDIKDLIGEETYNIIQNQDYLRKELWNGAYTLFEEVFKYYVFASINNTGGGSKNPFHSRSSAPFRNSFYIDNYPTYVDTNSGIYDSSIDPITGSTPTDVVGVINNFITTAPLVNGGFKTVLFSAYAQDNDSKNTTDYTKTSLGGQPLYSDKLRYITASSVIGVYNTLNSASIPDIKFAFKTTSNYKRVAEYDDSFTETSFAYSSYFTPLPQVNIGEVAKTAYVDPIISTVGGLNTYALMDSTDGLVMDQVPTATSAYPTPPDTFKFYQQRVAIDVESELSFIVFKIV